MSVNITKIPSPTKGETRYLVESKGKAVGLITKAKNTRTDIHPWKVFQINGAPLPNTMLATFYDDADSVKIGPAFDYEKCKIGGKVAAFTYARRAFRN